MNSIIQIKVRRYKILYSVEMTRPGEYVTEIRNNSPSNMAYVKTDRTCFGIRILSAAVKRRIARRATKEIQPTCKIFHMSKCAWDVSVPTIGALNIGGPNARRKIGYRRRNFRNERRPERRASGASYS